VDEVSDPQQNWFKIQKKVESISKSETSFVFGETEQMTSRLFVYQRLRCLLQKSHSIGQLNLKQVSL